MCLEKDLLAQSGHVSKISWFFGVICQGKNLVWIEKGDPKVLKSQCLRRIGPTEYTKGPNRLVQHLPHQDSHSLRVFPISDTPIYCSYQPTKPNFCSATHQIIIGYIIDVLLHIHNIPNVSCLNHLNHRV